MLVLGLSMWLTMVVLLSFGFARLTTWVAAVAVGLVVLAAHEYLLRR